MHSGAAGARAANSAPRRIQGGRSYIYNGRTLSAFHASPYHWPHGYRYHRYAVGYRLPHSFWIRDYYLDNYTDYGFDPPPVDFEWVRYGPDALLIDLDSGAIAQVVYGAFDDTTAGDEAADAPPDPSSDQ
jgi:Ni/Co efflux regulator RcnB